MAVPTPKRMAEEARPITRKTMMAAVSSRLKRISVGRFQAISSAETSTLVTVFSTFWVTPRRLRSFMPR